LLLKQPGAELRYLLGCGRDSLVDRLHAFLVESPCAPGQDFCLLGDLVTIRRGEELGKTSSLLASSSPTPGQEAYPVLLGGVEVRAYTTPMGQRWIAREAVVKPLQRYLAPKILVVKSTSELQAALDLRGHVVLQTLYLLQLNDAAPRSLPLGPMQDISGLDGYYFLLALLNSRLLREYVRVLYTAYKWVQPQMEQHVLANLPIPVIEHERCVRISERAKLLMHACGEGAPVVELQQQVRVLYEEQERAIRALYEEALEAHV
jgi:hypothetical protein